MRLGLGLGLDFFSQRGPLSGAGVPYAPTGLTVAQQDASLVLSWDAVPGLTWTVYRSEEVDDFPSAETLVSGLAAATWTDEELLPDVPYCYWVTATKADVESALSASVLGQLLPPQGTAVLMASVEVGGSAISLDWTEGDVELQTSWTLYSKAPSAISFSQQAGLTTRFSTFHAVETGAWKFYVKAVNALGAGEASNTAGVLLWIWPPEGFSYLRPVSGFRYLRPEGTSIYLRP